MRTHRFRYQHLEFASRSVVRISKGTLSDLSDILRATHLCGIYLNRGKKQFTVQKKRQVMVSVVRSVPRQYALGHKLSHTSSP